MNIVHIRKSKALLFKRTREEAGLTQDQLALMTGMRQSTISRMESGDYEWRCDSEYLYFEAINFYKANQLINQ
jgi:transcriptional regulator with XRE-family HTH domain